MVKNFLFIKFPELPISVVTNIILLIKVLHLQAYRQIHHIHSIVCCTLKTMMFTQKFPKYIYYTYICRNGIRSFSNP